MECFGFRRESSVRLINEVQQSNGMLAVFTQRDKNVDAPGPSDLYDVGTVSMVHRAMKTPEGNLFVIIMGVSRVRARQFVQFDPYLRAKIDVLQDQHEDAGSVDFQALRRLPHDRQGWPERYRPEPARHLRRQGRNQGRVRRAHDGQKPTP